MNRASETMCSILSSQNHISVIALIADLSRVDEVLCN